VYDEGVRVSGDALVLFVRPRQDDGPRIGLTAAKRIGGAVERNRVRRCVREAFRRNRDQFGPWDLVVNFRVGAADRTAARIEAELLDLARRARRILANRAPEARA
jgi:ribonuclease P protein component